MTRRDFFPIWRGSQGIRKFADKELEPIMDIECLKKSGLEIKDIKAFMEWCSQGSSTYSKRRELFERQKENIECRISHLEQALDMIKFKCWYYDTAIADGNEDRLKEMIPNALPPEIQQIYDRTHEKD